MSRPRKAHPSAPFFVTRVAGLSVALCLLACGTETPKPLPSQPVPEEPTEPVVPPSRLKFDVGTIPQLDPTLDAELATQMRERLASAEAAGIPLRSWETLWAFYEQREGRPAWIVGRQISAVAVDALRGLGQLPAHGLDPARYGTDALAPDGPEPEDPVGFELLLTDAWLTAATHLGQGRVDPKTLRATWTADGRADALISVLETALVERNPREALLAQAPSHAPYVARVDALEALHARARSDMGVKQDERLSARLSADQERLRWLPRELGARYLWLDHGAGALVMVEGSTRQPSIPVAASKRCRGLDALSTTITHVVVNPSDKGQGDYALRAADAAVVLHGAPEDGTPFPADGVARSGCLRLQDPRPLATALLRGDPTFDRAAGLPEVGGAEQVVALAEPVPLHITVTSVAFEGTTPTLRSGPRDAALRSALADGPKPVRTLKAPANEPTQAP